MSIVTNTPFAMFLRDGSSENPFVFITETDRRISDGGKLVLQEFPAQYNTGIILNNDENDPVTVQVFINVDNNGTPVETQMTQITDPSLPLGALQFRVDYQWGLLYFNPGLYGTEVLTRITYVGRGSYFVSASRIFTDDTYTGDTGEIPLTLQDIWDGFDPSFNISYIFADATERDNAAGPFSENDLSITTDNNTIALYKNGA